MDTQFKKDLIQKMEDKKLSPLSIKAYLRVLERLNDCKPLKNLTFLKQMDKIKEKIDKYAVNTQKTMYISVVACLCLYPALKKLCDKYREIMMKMNKSYREEAGKNEKSEKQQNAWMTWEEVEKIHDELAEKVDNLPGKNLTESQYNLILKLMILSLYTMEPPRRNRDYQFMNIVKSSSEKPDDRNLLIWINRNIFLIYIRLQRRKVKQYYQLMTNCLVLLNIIYLSILL